MLVASLDSSDLNTNRYNTKSSICNLIRFDKRLQQLLKMSQEDWTIPRWVPEKKRSQQKSIVFAIRVINDPSKCNNNKLILLPQWIFFYCGNWFHISIWMGKGFLKSVFPTPVIKIQLQLWNCQLFALSYQQNSLVLSNLNFHWLMLSDNNT